MKKSFQSALLAFVFLTVLLSSCAPASTSIPPTSTFLPPTVTPVPPTPTITPTLTPTPTATVLSSTGKIEGHVFQSDTNRFFSGASVELNIADLDSGDPGFNVAKTTTDSDGYYVFDEVAPGTYKLYIIFPIKKAEDYPCSLEPTKYTVDQNWYLASLKEEGNWGICLPCDPE